MFKIKTMINIVILYLALIICSSFYLLAVTIIPFLLLNLKDFPIVKLLAKELNKQNKNRLETMLDFYRLERKFAFRLIIVFVILLAMFPAKALFESLFGNWSKYIHYLALAQGWFFLLFSCWRTNQRISFVLKNSLTYFGRV